MNINLLFHLRLKLLLKKKKKKTLEVSNLIIKHTPLKLNANTNPKNMGCSLNWIMVHLDLDSPLFIYLFILSLKPHINIKNTISLIKFQTVLFWQTFWKTKGPKAFNKIKKRRKRKIRARLVCVFKNWKLLFKNTCGNTCGWKSILKCVKCYLKTENGCLKTQTKHLLKDERAVVCLTWT